MVKLRIRMKKRLSFPALGLRPDSVDTSDFAFNLEFMCLSRKEPEPHRDAKDQYQADVHDKAQKAGGSNIDQASHGTYDYSQQNPGCQRD
jgi:hypothetical protein